MGFKVVVEFVFRTAAKDGDWVKEHPEWFYWIKESVPLRAIQVHTMRPLRLAALHARRARPHPSDVREGRFDDLIPPHPVYRAFSPSRPLPENGEE